MANVQPRDHAVLEMTSRALRRFGQLHWISGRGMRPVFRLWHYPANGAWQSWVLFCPRPLILPGRPLVRHAWWDRDSDLERLGRDPRRRPDLHPSCGIQEAALSDETVRPVLEEASRLDLPPWGVVHPFTCQEVCEFGIEGFVDRPTTWVVWNLPVPRWMLPIARWAGRAREEFQRVLGGEGQAARVI